MNSYNISLEDVVAFGDGLNDIEMLDIVGEGFIMENGSETLKKKLPHLEVVGKNSEDGVAKKLAEIFNIHID
jgi:hydroxymethylpyrimidine pyrophosphatase-like HAD family hydrolase